jgi:hypothetical protein
VEAHHHQRLRYKPSFLGQGTPSQKSAATLMEKDKIALMMGSLVAVRATGRRES